MQYVFLSRDGTNLVKEADQYSCLKEVGTEKMEEMTTNLKTLAPDRRRRQVDFVLVWEVLVNEVEFKDRVTRREAYLQALLKAGLEFEEEEETGENALKFMKLHVPLKVLKQYAEVLKLRVVLKASLEDREMENLARREKKVDRMDLDLELSKSEDSHTSSQVRVGGGWWGVDPCNPSLTLLRFATQGSFR